MSGFKGGDENINREGRPKGSPNKKTQEVRESFHMFVEEQQDMFKEWIERVAEKNPAKAIELVTNLAEYILPKLSRTELKADIETKDKEDLSGMSLEDLQAIKEIRDKYKDE